MPAYGSIEHPEPRLSKTKSQMAISVMIGMLLFVAMAGAIRYVNFHESQAAVVGTKLLHSQYNSREHLALEQLTASLDRQLETLSQLEAKVLPSHLATNSVPPHVAADAHRHPGAVSDSHGPEGKSESFLADIMGIHSPAMESHHPELVKSFESKKSPSSCSLISLSSGLVITLFVILVAML